MADLYLASRSPRRRDLLKQIGIRFEPLIMRLAVPRGPDVDEVQRPGEPAAEYVERTAREKAERGVDIVSMRSMLHKPVLAADTVVILDGEVLGKPDDKQQAALYLQRLSGRQHEVRTSVAIGLAMGTQTHVLQETCISTVKFRALEQAEIEHYCATGEPQDKAGGYAIQGFAAVFIERIEGSYSGVMGLPLFETARLIQQAQKLYSGVTNPLLTCR